MKGYWTDSYYVGIMPNGQKAYFCTEGDYIEAYLEALQQDD